MALSTERDSFHIKIIPIFILITIISLVGTTKDTNAFKAIKRTTIAIRKNIRQAIKPTFKIQSRYAKPMQSVIFSNNDTVFATVSGNGSAQIWDTQTGQKIKDLRSNNGGITAAAFSQDANYIATGTNRGVVDLWLIHDERFHQTASIHSDTISSLIQIPKEGWLVSSRKGGIKLVDILSGSIQRTYSAYGMGEMLCFSVTPNRDTILTGHTDGTIRIWDFLSAKNILSINGKGGAVHSIAASSDNVLVAGLNNGNIKSWNLTTGKQQFSEKRHKSAVIAMAVTHDHLHLATGAEDGSIKLSEIGDKSQTILTGHEGAVNSICFSHNDQFLLSAGSDKTTRCWDWHQKKEIARIVVMRDGWAVVTPEGFFDGTLYGEEEDNLEAIQWMVEKSAYSVDQFLTYYYEPALLGDILQGKTIQRKPPIEQISEGFHLPPSLTLSIDGSFKTDQVMKKPVMKVVIEAVDQGGGIDEIRLYHNEKALSDTSATSVIKKDEEIPHVIKTYRVDLVNGQNVIKAVAFSDLRIESEAVEETVAYSSPIAVETTLHMVAIGINQYKDKNISSLESAVNDAKSVLNEIERVHSNDFDVFNRYELYDQDATLSNISNIFYALRELPPRDTVALYIAGHGDLANDKWHFLPYEHQLYKSVGLSSSTLTVKITEIGASKILLLIDSCHSGGFLDAFKSKKAFALLSRLSGIHVATAATREQYALELQDLGHGIFTYTFIEGINGKADQQPLDGIISVKEVLNYITMEVPSLIKKYRKLDGYHDLPDQIPVINLMGADFILTNISK